MIDTTNLLIGAGPGGSDPQALELKRANRRGLIAGATGTGKTVTLQGIVDGLSAIGVPAFVAAMKGDLSGLAMAGSPTARNQSLLEKVEQVVRLIHSKGVGVYFISQNPVDIPDKVAAQAAKAQAQADAARQRLDIQRQREADRQAAAAARQAQQNTAAAARQAQQNAAAAAREAARPTMTDKVIEPATRAVASSVGRQLGNQLIRGIFGGLFRGR